MMTRPWWIRTLGTAVVLLSIIFVVTRLWVLSDSATSRLHWIGLGRLLSLAAAAYALSNLWLALGWCWIVHRLGEHTMNTAQLHWIYAKSLLLKYLPGSVFQYVGRQFWGRTISSDQASLALATVLEIVSCILAAVPFLVAGLWWSGGNSLHLLGKIPIATSPVLLAIALGAGGVLIGLDVKYRYSRLLVHAAGSLCLAWIQYLAFMVSAGLALGILVAGLQPEALVASLMMGVLVYPVAWLVGFLTPIAPAGLGVREAALMVLLEPILQPEQAAFCALLSRLVTVIGDIAFFTSVALYQVYRQ